MAVTFDPFTGQYARTPDVVPTGFLPTYGQAIPSNPPGTMLGRAFGRGIDSIQQNLGSAVEGIGRSTGLDGLAQYGADVAAANQREVEQSARLERDGGITGYLADLVGSNAPQMIASVGLPIVGGLLGGPVGFGLGTAASGAFNYAQLAGENREAQKQADIAAGRPVEVEEGKAFGAAVPAAAAETLSGVIGGKIATGLLKGGTATKFLSTATAVNAGKAAVRGGVAEAPTEIIQQGLTMLQSGADMTPLEAGKQLFDAGLGGFLLGGILGGANSAGGDYMNVRAVRQMDAAKASNEALQASIDAALTPDKYAGPRQPDMQLTAPRGTATVINDQGDEVARPFQGATTEQLMQSLQGIEQRMAAGGSITQNDAKARQLMRAELARRPQEVAEPQPPQLFPQFRPEVLAMRDRAKALGLSDQTKFFNSLEATNEAELYDAVLDALDEDNPASKKAPETLVTLAQGLGVGRDFDAEIAKVIEARDKIAAKADPKPEDRQKFTELNKQAQALEAQKKAFADALSRLAARKNAAQQAITRKERDAAMQALPEGAQLDMFGAPRVAEPALQTQPEAQPAPQADPDQMELPFAPSAQELLAVVRDPNQTDMARQLAAAMLQRQAQDQATAQQAAQPDVQAEQFAQMEQALANQYLQEAEVAREAGPQPAPEPEPVAPLGPRLGPIPRTDQAVQMRLPTMGKMPRQTGPVTTEAPVNQRLDWLRAKQEMGVISRQELVELQGLQEGEQGVDPNAAMGSLLDRPVEPQALLQASKMVDPAGAVGEQLKSKLPSAVRAREFDAAEGQRLEQRGPQAERARNEIVGSPVTVTGIRMVNPVTAEATLSQGKPVLLQKRDDAENAAPGWYTQSNRFVGKTLSEARAGLQEMFAPQTAPEVETQAEPAPTMERQPRADRRERMLREKAEKERRENGIRFSRNDAGVAVGIKVTRASVAIRRITNQWRGGPAVEVVQSVADIDFSVLPDNVTAQSVGNAPGFYSRGRVYIIADNLRDANHAVATLYHEALTHFGFRQRYKNDLDAVLLQMYAQNAMVRGWVEEWRASGRVENWQDLPLHEQVEEALALQSEAGPMELKLFDKLKLVISKFVRMMGIKVNLTDAEVRAVMEEAHRFGMETRAPLNEAEVTLLEREAEAQAVRLKSDPAFQEWFGQSLARRKDGTPGTVFHGTFGDFSVFDFTHVKKNQLGVHVGTARQANEFATRGLKGYEREELDRWARNLEPGETPNAMRLYVRLERPLYLRDAGNWARSIIMRQLEVLHAGDRQAQELLDRLKGYEAAKTERDRQILNGMDVPPLDEDMYTRQQMQQSGYDGVVYVNRIEGLSEDDKVRAAELKYGDKKFDVGDIYRVSDEEFMTLLPSAEPSFIVFDPNQLKSATGNNGNYSRNSNDIRYSRNDAAKPAAAPQGPAQGSFNFDAEVPEAVREAVMEAADAARAMPVDTPAQAAKAVGTLSKKSSKTLDKIKKAAGQTGAGVKLRALELYFGSLGHLTARYGDLFKHSRGNYIQDLQDYHQGLVALRQRFSALGVRPYEMYTALRAKSEALADRVLDLMSMSQFKIDPRKPWEEHTWLQGHHFEAVLKRQWTKAHGTYKALSPEAKKVYDEAALANKALRYAELTSRLFNTINDTPEFAERVASAKTRNPALVWQQKKDAQDAGKTLAFFEGELKKLMGEATAAIAANRGLDPKDPDVAKMARLSDSTAKTITEIEAEIEAMEQAPYFHLGRFGDYIVEMDVPMQSGTKIVDPEAQAKVFKRLQDAGITGARLEQGGTSNRVFLRFETQAEADAFHGVALQLHKEGLLIKEPVKRDRRSSLTENFEVTSRILKGLQQDLEAEFPDDDDSDAARAGRALIAALRRRQTEKLPDISSAKINVHRDSVPGMTTEDMRAYAFRQEVAANSIANMVMSSQQTQALAGMQAAIKEAQTKPGRDVFTMQAVRNEILIRESQNPQNEAYNWVDSVKAFNHSYFLGFSPAYAFTQFTQLGALLWPELTKSFGARESANAIFRATPIALKVVKAAIATAYKEGGHRVADAQITTEILDGLTLDKNPQRDADIKKAIMKRVLSGMIDIGAPSRELGRGAEGRLTSNTELALRYASSFGFYAEVVTRLTAALATQELVDKRFKAWDDPKKDAFIANTINQSMLNYTNWYIGRAMGKSGMFKSFTPLVMAFQTYTAQLIEKLAREVHTGVVEAFTDYLSKADVPDARKEAQRAARRFLGYHMVAITALSGTLGLPGATVFATAIEMLHDLLSDDEEPFDAKAAWRNFLADTFGQDVGEILSRGVTRGFGFDISSRTGEADIIPFSKLIADKRDWQTKTEEWALRTLGSPISMFSGIYGGGKEMMNGNIMEGMTQALPVGFRALANSYTLTSKGYVDRQGNPLPMEAGALDIMYQALGFSPAERAEYTEANLVQDSRRGQLMREARNIRKNIAEAIEQGNQEDAMAWIEQARTFDVANPGYAVLPGMGTTLKQRARAQMISQTTMLPIGTNVRDPAAFDVTSFANLQR